MFVVCMYKCIYVGMRECQYYTEALMVFWSFFCLRCLRMAVSSM